MEIITYLFKGLLGNIAITACAVAVPLIMGILLSLLTKKVKIFGSICSWLNIGCEAVCLPIMVLFLFYGAPSILGIPLFREIDNFFRSELGLTTNLSAFLPVVIALLMAFFWYMPAKYNQAYSCVKNILYNGLGLIFNVFKWSTVAALLSYLDITTAAKQAFVTTYTITGVLVALVVMALILGAMELIRVVIKQFMK